MSLTSGQRVLMGCGVAALLVVGCFMLMIGGCVGLLFKGAKDFPPWAQASVVNPANKDVTDRVDSDIRGSKSPAEAIAKIAGETWPPKVIYIGTGKAFGIPGSSNEAYKSSTFSSNFTFSANGNGYGSVTTPTGKKDIVIIQRQGNTSDGTELHYEIFIEHGP